jgi:DNA-binding MarR family transcriptional regulator
VNPLLIFTEQNDHPDERRVRDFLDTSGGVSESVASLSHKLGLRRSRVRRILNQLVQEGIVERRDFEDIEPLYVRFPTR